MREPVAIAAAIRAVLVAAVAFGLKLDGEQIAGIVIAVEAILALVTRHVVTPVSSKVSTPDTEV